MSLGGLKTFLLIVKLATAGQASTVVLHSGNGGGSTDTLLTFCWARLGTTSRR